MSSVIIDVVVTYHIVCVTEDEFVLLQAID